MSEPESSSSVTVRQYDEGGESVDGTQRKRLKLDQGTQLLECEVPASKVKIDDLPDELIVIILSYYSFTELIEIGQNVCTQWRRASHDPLLWRNKEYRIDEDETDAKVLSVLPRVPQLRNLEINRHVKAAVIQAVCKNCKQLNYLKIEFLTRISLNLLKKLVASCRNIKCLIISAKLLSDENCAIVLSRMKMLESLTITGQTNESIHLGKLAYGCPVVSKLKILRVNGIYTEDLKQLINVKSKTLIHLELPWTLKDERCLVPMLTNCISLVKLELYSVSDNSYKLTQAFSALSDLINLRSLSLWFKDHVVPAHAFKSGGLRHLEALKIGCIFMESSILVALSEGCPNLRELHLEGCEGHDEGLLKELHRFKKLETFGFNAFDDLDAGEFLHLSRVGSLRKLLIEDCNFQELEDGLQFILHMNSLEILSFGYIQYISYFPFNRIPETLTNLRVLTVVECELNKNILDQLNDQMPELQIYAPMFVDRQFLEKMERIMKL